MSDGQVVKCPASIARHQVDNTGEKREAWKKATRLAILADEVGRRALACRKEGRGGGEGSVGGAIKASSSKFRVQS